VSWISPTTIPPAAARQRGAAIVTALLVVVLATSVVSALFLRESIAVRSIENRLALSQTRWIERAAIDWAKVILRADANAGNADHLGEPWAVPVAETKLDETVTAGAKIGENSRPAMLAGQIIDYQSKFNLNALVINGQVSKPHLDAARKLFNLIDVPESLVDMALARLLRSRAQVIDGRTIAAAETPLLRLTDLLGVTGFDTAILQRLDPFVVVIPLTPEAPAASLVNINTAPAEVIAAMVPTLDLAVARRFVVRRERTFFRDLNEASLQLDGQPVLPPVLLSVGSSYFMLRGMVRFDRVEVTSETLLVRTSGKVDIVWQQRL
jgi:general secretion pathway protein K